MRKRKRINNWQAEDDEKMKSLDIKQSTQNLLYRDSGVMLLCSLFVKKSGVQASQRSFFLKVNQGLNVR